MVCEEPYIQLNDWAPLYVTPSTVNDRPSGDVFTVTETLVGGTFTNWTPARSAAVPEGTWVQLVPPSGVLSTVPPTPTAQPISDVMKWTPVRSALTGCCSVHLAPPFVVFRMVPAEPTTQPVAASSNRTEWSDADTGLELVQVVPPLVVFRIVPSVPTAQPVEAFRK